MDLVEGAMVREREWGVGVLTEQGKTILLQRRGMQTAWGGRVDVTKYFFCMKINDVHII